MLVCFGLLKTAEYLTVLLKELTDFLLLGLDQSFLSIEDPIGIWITAILCMVLVHVRP